MFLADAAENDAQRDTEEVVEHPSALEAAQQAATHAAESVRVAEERLAEQRNKNDAQRSTPVGERPSKRIRELEMRSVRDVMRTIYREGKTL